MSKRFGCRAVSFRRIGSLNALADFSRDERDSNPLSRTESRWLDRRLRLDRDIHVLLALM